MAELLQLRLYASPAGPCLGARGRLDATTCRRLSAAVAVLLEHLAADRVLIDLRDLDAVDAAGVTTLILMRTRARQRGVRLAVTYPQPQVRAAICALGGGSLLADMRTADAVQSCRNSPADLRRRAPTRPRNLRQPRGPSYRSPAW